MENNDKLKTETKENFKLKVWEAPQLIMMDENETEAGSVTAAYENHSSPTVGIHS